MRGRALSAVFYNGKVTVSRNSRITHFDFSRGRRGTGIHINSERRVNSPDGASGVSREPLTEEKPVLTRGHGVGLGSAELPPTPDLALTKQATAQASRAAELRAAAEFLTSQGITYTKATAWCLSVVAVLYAYPSAGEAMSNFIGFVQVAFGAGAALCACAAGFHLMARRHLPESVPNPEPHGLHSDGVGVES